MFSQIKPTTPGSHENTLRLLQSASLSTFLDHTGVEGLKMGRYATCVDDM
ncbi:hypothetical protein Hanom_Chr08g00694801 [Helianthus anomalus]